jgi:hypothetical protein
MFEIAFAFVVACAVLMLFRNTRLIGAVGLFILLCISPLFFTLLLLLVGAAYYYFKRRSRFTQNPQRSGDADKGSRNLFTLLGTLGLGGALAVGSVTPRSGGAPSTTLDAVRSPASEEVVVLRTPGGLLEVSRIHATELLDARVTHKIFGVEIGELVPRIRVPAVYRYHVELAPEWRVLRTDGVFTVVAPKVRPSLPVAVDFMGIEKDVAGTWVLLPWKSRKDLEKLERSVTARLALKALSADYIDRQRQTARETVREFARKWLVEQTRWKDANHEEIQVLFADEQVGTIERLSR